MSIKLIHYLQKCQFKFELAFYFYLNKKFCLVNHYNKRVVGTLYSVILNLLESLISLKPPLTSIK